MINLIRHLPLDSALSRELYGPEASWDPALHRLTDIADLLIIANWQRGASDSTPKPALIPRPGEQSGQQAAKPHSNGHKVVTPQEFDELFRG